MIDQAYTIERCVGSPRDWDFSGNSYRSYYVNFEGDERRVEIAQKPETPAPNVGDTLTGHIEEQNRNGSVYFKFRKAKAGNFGGGGQPRPEDPARAKRIVRQHSQGMALQYAALRHSQGKLPDDFKLEDLFKIADRFDADANGAA